MTNGNANRPETVTDSICLMNRGEDFRIDARTINLIRVRSMVRIVNPEAFRPGAHSRAENIPACLLLIA